MAGNSMFMSMTTTAAAAQEGEGSSSTGGGPTIMQRPSSSTMRYKGVVQQKNGHWGAQIYAHHHRIWLGTFKSELAAAAAYDSAAMKLHRGDAHRNLPRDYESTIHEARFQEQFSTEAILEMIRNGSYESRFAEYQRIMQSYSRASLVAPPTMSSGSSPCSGIGGGGIICYEMFTKELTPSDVGKLYRLLIPKKHATRFFPEVSPESNDELRLGFWDPESWNLWVFRYCYRKSSKSYLFTKGWNQFVKDKRLRTKDSITFYRCQTHYIIKIIRHQQELGQEKEEMISNPTGVSEVTQVGQ